MYGRLDYGFGVATTPANNANVPTEFRDFMGGLKVRIPLGSIIPNVSVGYGQQTFEIAPAMSTLDLPQLAYPFVRPAPARAYLRARGRHRPRRRVPDGASIPGSGAGYRSSRRRSFPSTKALGLRPGARRVALPLDQRDRRARRRRRPAVFDDVQPAAPTPSGQRGRRSLPGHVRRPRGHPRRSGRCRARRRRASRRRARRPQAVETEEGAEAPTTKKNPEDG